jgi:hypothetical protein
MTAPGVDMNFRAVIDWHLYVIVSIDIRIS